MKIGDKVDVSMSSYMYNADGEIIGETPKFWKVKIINHKTMCVLWENQEEKIQLFHKDKLLNRGFWKGINNGCITSISKKDAPVSNSAKQSDKSEDLLNLIIFGLKENEMQSNN